MDKIGAEQFSTRMPDGSKELHGLGKIFVKRVCEANGGSFRAYNHSLGGKLHPALEIVRGRPEPF